MFKAIINNTGLIACCVYSKFFDVSAFRQCVLRDFDKIKIVVFDLVVQRSSVTGQVELDLELDSNNSTQASEQITTGQYIYRSIATNLETKSR
jgi:hypothetical protein